MQLNAALETIESSTKTQIRLVADILDVSRIVTGKMVLAVAPVALPTVDREAADVVMPAAAAKNIRLTVAIDDALPAVNGDPDRLRQVVWNLLQNAVNFTPSGGAVDVGLTARNGDVLIRVADTGEGISPEFLPHLFERFRQADSGRARRHGGLGLGLSLFRHLVEMHGGRVTADSDGLGRGATFTVSLPAHNDG